MASALLALEDGKIFYGEAFGASGTVTGEVCFNTSMSGYQEALTDPSYHGQILAMTYPLIGNYGINALDQESDKLHACGFVIGELSPVASSWRSGKELETYLAENGILGIQDVDTRALTCHIREKGSLKGCLTTELDAAEALEKARQSEGMEGRDLVREVTTKSVYAWDPDGVESRRWTVVRGDDREAIEVDAEGNAFFPLPPIKYRIVAYDFGMKRNILRRLRQNGFQVTVVPAQTPAEEVLALDPDGVFLSNGPGDPATLDYAHAACRKLIGKKPIFGICLGHQILSYAFGGKTYKLKFGHRGGNHPVKDLETGRISITCQNHGFAVDPESMPKEIEVTHINLNDGTIAGMRHRTEKIFSVQFHPEASPGPNEAADLFGRFAKLIESAKKDI